MKKAMILAVLALVIGTSTMAQEEVKSNWTKEGSFGLNFAQSSYTNWAAGGQNALNWQGIFKYTINYAKDNLKWDNSLNTALGYSYFDFKEKPVKIDDKIEFTSLAGLKATEHLNYSLELAFRSQFAKGFDYTTDSTTYISKFLAPAYITLGLGMEWVPNEHFSVNFAPVTGRITIVNDDRLADAGAYGVDKGYFSPTDTLTWIEGKKVRFEFGARLAAKLKYTIVKNVDFESKLELFSNYLKNPQYIDVDWQNLLVMKVNSWLNCSFSTHLIYDYDTPFYDINAAGESILDPNSKVQFKEVLSVGFMIKF
ncbi:MAG: DUF3078 domain-containing protein [Bacteroidales bacterium]|nr:DUF3078 domain-containing protein [Bacteroidales bacterium]